MFIFSCFYKRKYFQIGIIGYGYGSEWHLLRFIGRHRSLFNRKIENIIKEDLSNNKVKFLDWLDFNLNENKQFYDSEWGGLDFLAEDNPIYNLWREFWPQSGTQPNWDAIGIIQVDTHAEIILVEAKAHIEEMKSECKAKENGGRPRIRKAIKETIEYYQKKLIESDENGCQHWLKPYYQFANRLCVLYFLNKNNISARLVNIYFLNDNAHLFKNGEGLSKGDFCPVEQKDWEIERNKMYETLDFQKDARGIFKIGRVHKVFFDVRKDTVKKK